MPIGFLRRQFLTYLQEFIHDSRAIGIILFGCTIVSLIVANLPIGPDVVGFITKDFEVLHHLGLPHSPEHFINDGLMAVFFFLVGMEIKRELTVGELSSVKRALLPIAAAVGGMLVPASIFMLLNKGGEFQHGWGIPMATDIAFSLGVASMMGKRFPNNLKVFLTALAIIDDLGAILVIAFFYGGSVQWWFMLAAALVVGLLWLCNALKVKFGIIQVLLGLALWYCVFNSGIHATIAGVVFAFFVPDDKLAELELKMHNPVNFLILPLFALANTAIPLNIGMVHNLGSTLSLGIILGLFIGKPLGIFFACWLLVRKGVAIMPRGIGWNHLIGAGVLAGIGFTMSIFIACLAFSSREVQDVAKLAILLAAVISVAASFIWFYWRGAG